MTGGRRQAREECFKALYRMAVSDDPVETAVAEIQSDRTVDEEAAGYAAHLVTLCDLNREEIDALLAEHLDRWRLDRVAQTDRAILRMAVTELLYGGDVPPKVVIDEAIDIARKYGTDASGRFVNGVLDSVARARGEL